MSEEAGGTEEFVAEAPVAAPTTPLSKARARLATEVSKPGLSERDIKVLEARREAAVRDEEIAAHKAQRAVNLQRDLNKAKANADPELKAEVDRTIQELQQPYTPPPRGVDALSLSLTPDQRAAMEDDLKHFRVRFGELRANQALQAAAEKMKAEHAKKVADAIQEQAMFDEFMRLSIHSPPPK